MKKTYGILKNLSYNVQSVPYVIMNSSHTLPREVLC